MRLKSGKKSATIPKKRQYAILGERNVKKSLRTNGIVTYWHLEPAFDRKKVQDALESLGFEREAPEAVKEAKVLEPALRDLFPRPAIIRSIKHGTGWQVLEEHPNFGRNEYDTTLTAIVSPQGELSVDPASYQDQVADRWKYHLGILGNEEFARSLVAILRKLGGLYLRPMGAVYWLPEESVDQWEKVLEVVQTCGISDEESLVERWTAVFDDRGQKAIRNAMIRDIHDRLKYILNRVMNPRFRAKFLRARLREIEDLKTLGRRYSQVLRKPIPEISQKLQLAEEAAMLTGKARFPSEF
jgi:hypothetical protein